MQEQMSLCWARWWLALNRGNVAEMVREKRRIEALKKVEGHARATRRALATVLPCLAGAR